MDVDAISVHSASRSTHGNSTISGSPDRPDADDSSTLAKHGLSGKTIDIITGVSTGSLLLRCSLCVDRTFRSRMPLQIPGSRDFPMQRPQITDLLTEVRLIWAFNARRGSRESSAVLRLWVAISTRCSAEREGTAKASYRQKRRQSRSCQLSGYNKPHP
ncbi:hypothetical protein NEOLEDRAFT_1128547 [Neolentinus lepideus HHB14362 ss-1]|uniref:Uncharacterized protein n=1 Tax=Neolentinus lepideus HHB14362 ss-1 TaxID=1314782 RepID=A0A165V202_9AGAM|nr:hypothetical protein NEOLEDRAFT_1128547 [Neolentinus lepideus HHB14362 ss-1]